MKRILKSLLICLGTLILSQLIIGFCVGIGSVVLDSFEKVEKQLYIYVTIGDLITIVLAYLMYNVYDKNLLSKDTFKRIRLNDLYTLVLLGIGFSVVVLFLTLFLTFIFPSYSKVQEQLSSASQSLLQLATIIIVIPICEEIIYRRIIFDHLRRNYNLVCAIIIQSIIFGIAHGNIVQGIYAFVLGLVLALVYINYNSLWANIILHIIFNLMGICVIPKLIGFNENFIYLLVIIGVVSLVISFSKFKKQQKALF